MATKKPTTGKTMKKIANKLSEDETLKELTKAKKGVKISKAEYGGSGVKIPIPKPVGPISKVGIKSR